MSAEPTGSAHRCAAGERPLKQEQQRASDTIAEVAPGVVRAQLPIDLPGLGHVNCYLLEDERGLAVVDPGLPGDDAWRDLVDRLRSAGYRVDDVHTVVVTHSHPDHFGGAARLSAEANADVVTHRAFSLAIDHLDDAGHADEDSSQLEVNSDAERAEALERYFTSATPWGTPRTPPPAALLDQIKQWIKTGVYVPAPTIRLDDGQPIMLARREWYAIHTPGHTDDHLCLFDPEGGIVLAGDHVLPTITPHISGLSPGADPLAEFFGSLQRMIELDGVEVALPAHGEPISVLGERAAAIIEHHHSRLDTIRTALDTQPTGTVAEFMRLLFRERSWGTMAESETYAHLEHLRALGEVERVEADGVVRYRNLR